MRRKNGYTLTEILVVVLLLSIVGGIIIFNVNVVLNNNKTKSYEKYIAQVKSSAETYASLNQDAINDLYENKSYTYVKVGDLIDHGFLDEKLTNPYTGEKISREELVKLSLSTETGNLTITYPVVEENKEVFLSSVVLSKTVGNQVDCMEGIGTYTLALSDETGKLILDKNTLINDYNFSCKLPDNFTKTAGTMNNEIGSTEQVGTYEITYNWISKSGTKGTGTRFLKVVPGTIKVTYNVDVLEGKPADAWTPATCMGTISEDGICSKNILVNYNYNTLSKPYRRGYTLLGWYTEKQTDPENPGINGNLITENTKVLNKEDHTIYAHWDRKRYGVTLDSTLNGRPAISPGTQTVTAKYNLPLEDIEIPTRYFDIVFNKNDVSESNGTTEATISHDNLVATWDFKGYYSSSNDMYINETGKGIKNWDIDEETILKAKWENGRITLPDASRPGYTFEGWYTGATGGELRDNDYQYEMSDVLYAQWKPITYVVKLNYNDDDGGSTKANENIEQINVTFDSNFENLFDASRTGYMFEGWYTNDGRLIEKSTLATNDYQIIENDGIELTAKWSKIKYAISLDLNKQTAMSNDPSLTGSNLIEVTFDEAVSNLEVPSVIGWTFDGWYDSDNLKVFNANGSINFDTTKYIDSNRRWIYPDGLSLYAHWSQKNYTLTLDLNRPTAMSHTPVFNPDHSNTYQMTYDSTNNNVIVTGTVEGWTFKGWYDSTGDMVYDSTGKYVESSKNYFKNAKWHYDNDLTIYAHWEQKRIVLSLDVNRPSNMSTAPSVGVNTYINVYDDNGIKTINAASTTGWAFNGWYDSSNLLVYNSTGNYNTSVTKYINANGKWIYDNTLVLYAHWTANTFTVNFNGNGNDSGSTASISCTYDSNCNLPNNGYGRIGYSFTGWKKNNTGDTLSAGASIKNTITSGSTTYYAQWDPNKYTVTFDKQGGTGGSDTATPTYTKDLDKISTPTRTGYTFAGYYTETNGKGTQYYNASGTGVRKWDIPNDTKLYAYWTPNKYNVNISVDSNIENSNSISVEYGSTGTVKIKAKTGYYISGASCSNNWNISVKTSNDTGSGTPYPTVVTYTISNNSVANNTTCSFTSTAKTIVYVSNNSNSSITGSANLPFRSLSDAYDNLPNGGEIRLQSGITVTSKADFNKGKNIVLTGNNNTITRNTNNQIIDLTSGSLTINNTKFDGNKNNISGTNAIISQLNNTNLTLNGVEIKNAKNEFDGGALFCAGSASNGTPSSHLTVSNSTFTNNESHSGGGVFSMDCDIKIDHTTINNNKASNEGGALYLSGDNNITRKLELTDNIMEFNEALYGGAIHGYSITGTTIVDITRGTIDNNVATYEGGGISISKTENDSSSMILNIRGTDGNASIVGSNRAHQGGGIRVINSIANVYNNADINYNKATILSDNPEGSGGGLFLWNAKLNLDGGTIRDNQANWGGGVAVHGGSEMTFSNGSVNNNAAYKNGGGIDVNTSTLNMTGGIVTDNTCAGEGNVCYATAIFIYNGSTFNRSGGTVNGSIDEA